MVEKSPSGIWGAVTVYIIWGLFPLYWKALHHIPSLEILAHRVLWSALMLGVYFLFTGRYRFIWHRFQTHMGSFMLVVLSAVFIASNWYLYIWAVNHNFILETSLGYFLNPLINFILGLYFFRERFLPRQWPAFILVFSGLFYLTFQYGKLPTLSLLIALTFACYTLCKKLSHLSSLDSLWPESMVLFPFCAVYLLHLEWMGQGHFGHQSSWWSEILLIGCGPITFIPLYLYGSVTKKISLSLLGLLQYISPIGQFLIGVFLYHEPLGQIQKTTFILIFSGLLYFAIERFHFSYGLRRKGQHN